MQYWNTGRGDDVVREAVGRGAQVLLSPASKICLDMKYDNDTPLGSEILETVEDVEMMAFPRLPAIAEVAWSAQEGREWQDFRRRLGAQAPRWKAMKLGFYESPQINWAK